ncbi:ATPase [Sphingobacteriaceae bacterium]|nr:ATPase [Sphingobacteriaceae bacterium]
MYVILADSGSTKTDWILLKDSEVIKEVKTIGFNPYFQTVEQISAELINNLKPHFHNHLQEVEEVHYYGTGCSTDANRNLIKESITKALGISKVNVDHDLLAAARALCKKEWGIACILGTGSNSCLYNGKDILENVPSTGYLWSDYGGGSQIGKYFIRDYFEGRTPSEVVKAFEDAGYNREVILDNVYKHSVPGRYLASINGFVCTHLNHPYIISLLKECFESFFVQQINKYSESRKYTVHTVGSIGYYYKDLIAEVAAKHGYTMGTVIRSPMEGLINFHSNL